MRTDAEQIETLADVLNSPDNTFVYNIKPENYKDVIDFLKFRVGYSTVSFSDFLQGGFEVPELPQLNSIVEDCYKRELEKGRTPNSEDLKKRATIIITGMFDPSVFGGNTENYFRLFREMISDEKYNPGIKFILVEDPLLKPGLSEKKDTENLLYGAVKYVNMDTGQSNKVIL